MAYLNTGLLDTCKWCELELRTEYQWYKNTSLNLVLQKAYKYISLLYEKKKKFKFFGWSPLTRTIKCNSHHKTFSLELKKTVRIQHVCNTAFEKLRRAWSISSVVVAVAPVRLSLGGATGIRLWALHKGTKTGWVKDGPKAHDCLLLWLSTALYKLPSNGYLKLHQQHKKRKENPHKSHMHRESSVSNDPLSPDLGNRMRVYLVQTAHQRQQGIHGLVLQDVCVLLSNKNKRFQQCSFVGGKERD